jgi:hypothetical protein
MMPKVMHRCAVLWMETQCRILQFSDSVVQGSIVHVVQGLRRKSIVYCGTVYHDEGTKIQTLPHTQNTK